MVHDLSERIQQGQKSALRFTGEIAHQSAQVESGGAQHGLNAVAQFILQVAAVQAVVCLQVANNRDVLPVLNSKVD